jgi:FkbM family methyltransferase
MLLDLIQAAGIDLRFTMIEIGALPLSGHPEPFYRLLEDAPRSQLCAFEVDAVLCARLNQEARPGTRYFPAAIGGGNGKRPFYETEHPMCASLYPPDERWREIFGQLDVMRLERVTALETLTLDDFAAREAIGPVDFIKMDIQGAELEALRGARQVLRGVSLIVSEVEFIPLYVGQPLFGDVDAHLRQQGFMLHKFLGLSGRPAKPMAFNNDPCFPVQVMWSDAVFIRDLCQLDQRTVQQLLKLAVLLELYASPDLAHYLLRVCDQRGVTALADDYLEALTKRV